MQFSQPLFKALLKSGLIKLKPAIFLHLQKTAGTSIINLAKQYYGSMNVISHGDFFLKTEKFSSSEGNQIHTKSGFSTLEHIPFISGHFGYEYAKKFLANRYSFTFLRDPLERILSFYYFSKTRNPKQFAIFEMAQQLPLDDFLKLGFTDPVVKSQIWNYQVSQLADGWGSSRNTQLSDNELLDLAIQHLDEFSYIGFTESFTQDLNIILKDLGIFIPVENQVSNANPGRPLVSDLADSTKELLLELTELDRPFYDKAWARRSHETFNS